MGVHHLHVVLCGSQDKDKMAGTPHSWLSLPLKLETTENSDSPLKARSFTSYRCHCFVPHGWFPPQHHCFCPFHSARVRFPAAPRLLTFPLGLAVFTTWSCMLLRDRNG